MAKILVVDDKEDVCRLMSEVLQAEGHEVITQHTVEGGISVLRWHSDAKEPFEICLIDLRFDNYQGDATLPATAGMLVLEEALKVRFLEPIILTAFGSTENAAQALAKGVFRYVSKTSESASALRVNRTFIDQLIGMVSLAVGNREVFRSLDEALVELRALFQELRRSGGDAQLVGIASNYLSLAEKADAIILKARGRHPG